MNSPRKETHRLNVLPQNPEGLGENEVVAGGRFPSWLHRKMPQGSHLWDTGRVLSENRLHTVCEEARCPNLLECWSQKTATFLVMGKACTRACGFCSIDFTKQPALPDPEEPARVAQSAKTLGLKHVVITMVARDDLIDGGASHIASIVEKLRQELPASTVEVLISDLQGDQQACDQVLAAKPDVFNHNIETVRSLTPRVRHKATYERTLALLKYAALHGHENLWIKSGLMVGLGESKEEVFATLRDLKEAGCSVVTIGQYLQPDSHKLLVKAFIHPDTFKEYEQYGHSIGISHMYCGPFVRSSYHAADLFAQKEARHESR